MRLYVLVWIFSGATAISAQVLASYTSFTSYTKLDPGTSGIEMVTDSSGTSLIHVVPGLFFTGQDSIARVASDGSVIDKKPFSGMNLTLGSQGTLWASDGNGLMKYDSNNNLILSLKLPGSGEVMALTSDAVGNLYAVRGDSGIDFGITVFQLTSAGELHRSYHVYSDVANGFVSPEAIAVDVAGFIYIAGKTTNPQFVTTAGAYMEHDPALGHYSDGFVMKLAPGLTSVVYSTLLGGEADDDVHSIVVDSSGDAFVSGYSAVFPDKKALPLSIIGQPVSPSGANVAYVAKLNATGSVLIYAVGLCGGDVLSIVLAPDGTVHTLVEADARTAGVFSIGPSGNTIERSQFLNGMWFQTQFPGKQGAVINLLSDGRLRVLTAMNSTRFPVVPREFISSAPVVVDLPAAPLQAELSVTVSSPHPIVPGSDEILRVVVANAGPGVAESVWVNQGHTSDMIGNCSSNAFANCLADGQTLIPSIPAGGTVWVEYHIRTSYVGLSQPLNESVLVTSLSSETNLLDDLASSQVPIAKGELMSFGGLPVDAYYYRSDFIGRRKTTDSSLVGISGFPVTVTVPSPQRWNGNLWYFDSWLDGTNDNPRTFDRAPDFKPSASMQFRPAQAIGLEPSSLDLVALLGSSPLPRGLTLYPITGGSGTWSITAPTVGWLALDQLKTSQTGQATLTVTGNIRDLSRGYYATSLTAEFDRPGFPAQVVRIPVSLRIMDQQPSISTGGIVDSASYRGSPFSETELVTIYGTGLGPPEIQNAPQIAEGQIPTQLGGTRVLFNGVPAPLLYVQENQIAAIIPTDISWVPGTSATEWEVTIELGGGAFASTRVNFTDYSPALFTTDNSGRGALAAVNQDGSINSSSSPAARGEMVMLYGTGLSGQDLRGRPEGCEANQFGSNLAARIFPGIEAYIGGRPADVIYAGSAQGLPCSVQQINILVPENSDEGPSVPVTLRIIGPGDPTFIPVQDHLTIAVK